jgi:hypothetical protein
MLVSCLTFSWTGPALQLSFLIVLNAKMHWKKGKAWFLFAVYSETFPSSCDSCSKDQRLGTIQPPLNPTDHRELNRAHPHCLPGLACNRIQYIFFY